MEREREMVVRRSEMKIPFGRGLLSLLVGLVD
jgi:hypothetical protein